MNVVVRISKATSDHLKVLLFRRYPHQEWASFALSGWAELEDGLALSLAQVVEAGPGDLNERVGHAQFMEPYTLRMALTAEALPLAVTVLHSHPEGYVSLPSHIDDDMDEYFADYFSGFAPDRPYASLIFSLHGENLVVGGRVQWKGRWHWVASFKIEGTPAITITPHSAPDRAHDLESVRRLADAFGKQAALRLRGASVAVVGASGTGSVAIEILARAGVGHLVIVDPDKFAESNLERLHGSGHANVSEAPYKVELARRHVREINPNIQVTAIVGRLPQRKVVEQLLGAADLVLGCTDSNAARVALADLAWRYAVPAIDVGVQLEGANGDVLALIGNLVQFGAGRPCALCQRMYDPDRTSYELMSETEKDQRRRAAARAREGERDEHPYWFEQPQLNTVGFLTSAAASMAAGYAIGLLTNRFVMPFERLQFDLAKPLLDTIDHFFSARAHCVCQRKIAWGDCARADAVISAPIHWPDAVVL